VNTGIRPVIANNSVKTVAPASSDQEADAARPSNLQAAQEELPQRITENTQRAIVPILTRASSWPMPSI